jgi:hypothetical protein
VLLAGLGGSLLLNVMQPANINGNTKAIKVTRI